MFVCHWRKANRIKVKIIPTNRSIVIVLEPPHPQKINLPGIVVWHPISSVDYVDVINAEDASIQKVCANLSTRSARICEEHDVAMGGTRVYDVLRSSDVVCSVIESGQVMAVHAIVLEKYRITFLSIVLEHSG
jgi:hypothetical protein